MKIVKSAIPTILSKCNKIKTFAPSKSRGFKLQLKSIRFNKGLTDNVPIDPITLFISYPIKFTYSHYIKLCSLKD